jgi:hypothetical protein
LAQRLHCLGARATFEFIDELAKHYPTIADDLDRRLSRFVRIDPVVLAAVGGDRFPSSPTRIVGRSR